MLKTGGVLARGVNLGLLCVCVVGAGCQTSASSEGGGKRAGAERRRRTLPPLVMALNANSDRWLESDEIAQAPASLKKLDKSGDGRLTREEYWKARAPRSGEQSFPEENATVEQEDAQAPPAPERSQGGRSRAGKKRSLPLLITALDPNGDFVIDSDEIARSSAALRKLDTNGDGRLSGEELGLRSAGKP